MRLKKKKKMGNRDVRAIMRGHLISIDAPTSKLKKFGDEFYKTKHWNIIMGNTFISFKKFDKAYRFSFKDIKKFFLQDSETFVFNVENNKERFYFKIVN